VDFQFTYQTAKLFQQDKISNDQNLQTETVAPCTIKTSVRASRRHAPESLKEVSAQRGPGEALGAVTPREGVRDAGRLMHPQPRAQKRVARPRTSIHSGGTGKPGNPARNGVTLYAVLSSGRCSIAPVLLRKMVCKARLGRRTSEGITPASGAGPHGLRVRSEHRSSCATFRQLTATPRGASALPTQITPDTTASIASHPASVTTAIRPLGGTRRRYL